MFRFGDNKEKDESKEAAPADEGAEADGAPPVSGSQGEEVSEGKKVGNMRSGDYLVHILIYSAKNLVLDDEDTVDPFIKINILGQEKSTSIKKDISCNSKVTFEEHLFMELKNVSKEDIGNSNILLSVVNKGFFKGDDIGQFEMAVTKIYNMKNHVMEH